MNFAGFTSEVRYTDRVMTWPKRWLVTTGMDPAAQSINSRVLYRMASGDVGDYAYFPMNAVRWLTPPRKIAALVTDSGSRFAAQLFHFGKSERSMGAELYLLPRGEYTCSWKVDGERLSMMPTKLTVDSTKTKVSFRLPPQQLVTVEILPVQ
jgi:hypothetical protein